MTAFTATLESLISDIGTITNFFVNQFVSIADMFFNSPFVIYIGLGIIVSILGIVAAFLRIKSSASSKTDH